MAQVTVDVNGKPNPVGCEDGQEAHVHELAKIFDEQVTQVAHAVGQLGEARLFLMGALMLADELSDLRARLAHAQADLAEIQGGQAEKELRAVTALDSAALKIEALIAKV